MTLGDRFDLDRFVNAQAPVFETVLAELRAGRKRSHWMWFVFPQLAGLGHSSMAQLYAINSIDEARAYLAFAPPKTRSLHEDRACERGSFPTCDFRLPDDVKFGSCMTLFSLASDNPDNPFRSALDRWCSGPPDDRTLALIKAVRLV